MVINKATGRGLRRLTLIRVAEVRPRGEAVIDARKELANKVAPSWAAAVKEKYSQNGARFACVGCCFGSTFVFDMLKTGICEVGAVAHPTFLTEKHFEDVTSTLAHIAGCHHEIP